MVQSTIGGELARLADALARSHRRVAAAESVTGGGVSSHLVGRPDVSPHFIGGIVAYDTQVKIDVLGVDPDDIVRHGFVSEVVTVAMAKGVRSLLRADFAVATTGLAGPSDGGTDQPVGTVCVAVVGFDGRHRVKTTVLIGDRRRISEGAELLALSMLAALVGGTVGDTGDDG